MKNSPISILRPFIFAAALSLSIAGIKAAAATAIPREFWVSTNATANFYPAAAGTIDSPLDGSSQANFDANVNGLPENSTIHILAGTYQTRGVVLKSYQKLMGSGKNVTTLQFPAGLYIGGSGACVVYGEGTNIEVSDMTLDCNAANNIDTYCGVELGGMEHAIRRVHVIHCGKYGGNSEAWGIVISNFHHPDSTGNIIEGCDVTDFTGGGGISCISLNGGSDNNAISGIIRNNHVALTYTNAIVNGGCCAINGSWEHDTLIDGNIVENIGGGVYGDTGWSRSVTIVNNHFVNVGFGVMYQQQKRKNIIIANNQIRVYDLFDPANTNTYPCVAIYFYWPNATYTNISIIGNSIEYTNASHAATGQSVVAGANISGLMMAHNRYDAIYGYWWQVGSSSVNSGINVHDNYDLNGNQMSGFGGYQFNDGPVAIGSSLNVSGTITGNGNGLTALNASQLTSGSVPLSRMNVIDAAHGGLGIDVSTWGAGLFPYTTATGSFGSAPISTYGLGLVSQPTFSQALSYLHLPADPSVIITNNETVPVTLNASLAVNGNVSLTNGSVNVPAGSAYLYNGVNLAYGNTSLGNYFLAASGNSYMTAPCNLGFGAGALLSNSNSPFNVAIGQGALRNLQNGDGQNTACGMSALYNSVAGTWNVAVGANALYSQTNASGNTAVGVGAINHNVSGSWNMACGLSAMTANTTGGWNTAIGANALFANTGGNYNIGLGVNAGYNPTNGSYNIEIGNVGLASDDHVTRLGDSQTDTYIAGAVHAASNLTAGGNITGIGSLTITNATLTNWVALSVTSSNAVISVEGVTVAILQTNGVLNAANGISTTVSNTLPPSVVSLTGTGVAWTNTTPWNIVSYVSSTNGPAAMYYNGAAVFNNVTTATMMLKPGAVFAATNGASPVAINLSWHPF
ncbi:MAG TPA: hypothetical protein VF988_05685 [Verrucomicrobiae bacterium]